MFLFWGQGMSTKDIKHAIKKYIIQISEESEHPITHVEGHHSVVEDLGMTSLQIAMLISFLSTDLDTDPFSCNLVAITDIRTVDDLCDAYEKSLSQSTE